MTGVRKREQVRIDVPIKDVRAETVEYRCDACQCDRIGGSPGAIVREGRQFFDVINMKMGQ